MISHNASQTKKIAADLAKRILFSKPHFQHARVVGLVGDLGAGKTTFAQGFAKALGIRHRIISPTFLIFRNYELGIKNYGFFYHVDVYRIENPKELSVLKFKDILKNSQNIVLIEWAEKIKKILPKDTIWVEFKHADRETKRLIAY